MKLRAAGQRRWVAGPMSWAARWYRKVYVDYVRPKVPT